jgi:hypothetical protein
VQRLAKIAHGDRTLTAASLVPVHTTAIRFAANETATEAGGISA